MRKLPVLALALLVLGAAGGPARAAAAPKRRARAGVSDDDSGIDKKRFERYLKDRLTQIKAAQDARGKFFAHEQLDWTTFWGKIAEDRKKFEIRMTRQMLDVFESLASLDPKDHATTIANYERMQDDFMKSFEDQQKQKIQDFFAARQQRWADFAADQEKERADFMAEAKQGWEDNKNAVLAQLDPGAAPDAAPAGKKSADERPARRPARSPLVKAADDKWH